MPDYIKWIRSKVGHDPVILTFSGAAISDQNGAILLQKRKADQNIWGIPGGALEYGESAIEALHREVMEETGLIIKINYLIGVYTKYFMKYENEDQAQVISFFFHCSIIGGKLRLDNHETFGLDYFTQANLPPLFNTQQQEMVNDFFQGRKWVCK